jgi:DNA-binding transcriptional MerR regulator
VEQARVDRAEPEYTMQAVVSRTGVPADTIRSWERRHGFPRPGRDGTNQRVYSEADIQVILQLNELKASGWTTSQAIERLRAPGQPVGDTEKLDAVTPIVRDASPVSSLRPGNDRSLATLAETLDRYDGQSARRLLDDILAVRSVEHVLFSLLLPLIDDSSDRDPVHAFRHDFVRRLLYSLYHASAPDSGRSTVMLLGMPGSATTRHLLCHAICLSRVGYRTILLGADIPLRRAESMLARVQPEALLMGADSEDAAWTLARWAERLENEQPIDNWNGILLFTGSIFEAHPGLADAIPGIRIPDDPDQARANIEHALANPALSLHVVNES